MLSHDAAVQVLFINNLPYCGSVQTALPLWESSSIRSTAVHRRYRCACGSANDTFYVTKHPSLEAYAEDLRGLSCKGIVRTLVPR